jgi:hypothetical protein
LAVLAAEPDRWYPRDVTPPPGTQYPCALTALPETLPGIPEGDRRFIDHAYALILRAVHARLKVYTALASAAPDRKDLDLYLKSTDVLLGKLRRETPPAGLLPFRDEVIGAVELQRTFYKKAFALRRAGKSLSDALAPPEGREASSKLQAAWSEMERRYPGWPKETSEPVYHHLCALDIF